MRPPQPDRARGPTASDHAPVTTKSISSPIHETPLDRNKDRTVAVYVRSDLHDGGARLWARRGGSKLPNQERMNIEDMVS